MATAGGLFGHVGEFSSEREAFKSYVERMEMFFTANSIVETPGEENEGANQLVKDRKRAIFLTEIGADVYPTLSNLLVPAKPKDTSLANFFQALEKHFNPAPLEIAESFHFGTRSQKPDTEQTVDHRKYHIRQSLSDCESMEMAERNTQEFHPTTSASASSEGTVNQIESKRNDEQACYRCGGNHTAKTCRFKTEKCFKCTKIGHVASVCRSKTSKEVKPGSTSKHGQADRGNIQNLSLYDSNNDNVNSDELGIYSLYSVESENYSHKRYNVELSLNGVVCDMEIDTAADFSIMSKSMYDQKFSHFPLYPSAVKLKTYTGEILQVSGEIKCEIVHQNKTFRLPIVIANYVGKPTLLGKNWLAQMKLDWGRVFSIKTSEQSNARDQLNVLLSKYKNMFEDSYEGMKGFEAHITMKDGARPVFVKPRKVPYALKEAVEAELEKLERNDVIKKN
ncbi:Transposon Ty3-I Gag-Pol poly [Paramuricea clavata]|uniref:Transposon Ty3-I Gag-Pol poly n=1 Tax=Paramuricea clavata TaxID=317549 RepID=A0A6S7JYF9_PARCT|nr:Transposon Ty3-I Gag-Pol poly [Paramuricea clavata]